MRSKFSPPNLRSTPSVKMNLTKRFRFKKIGRSSGIAKIDT